MTLSAQQNNIIHSDSLSESNHRMFRKRIPSPERKARMEANKMNKLISLTDEQYSKSLRMRFHINSGTFVFYLVFYFENYTFVPRKGLLV